MVHALHAQTYLPDKGNYNQLSITNDLQLQTFDLVLLTAGSWQLYSYAAKSMRVQA